MGVGLLNRICEEELKKVIRESIKELNNEVKNNTCFDVIHTHITGKRYFVTLSDLSKVLNEMEENGEIRYIKPNPFSMDAGYYQLNHEPVGEAI